MTGTQGRRCTRFTETVASRRFAAFRVSLQECSGMGNAPIHMNRAFSFKGIVVALTLLLLVSLVGFASINSC